MIFMLSNFLEILAEIQKGSKKVEQCIGKCIPVVSEEFLLNVKRERMQETVKKYELVPTNQKVSFHYLLSCLFS